MSGNCCSNAQVLDSSTSSAEPFTDRCYFGGSAVANADRTVFAGHPQPTRDGFDRRVRRQMQPTDLSPVLHSDHSPGSPGVNFRPAPGGQCSGSIDSGRCQLILPFIALIFLQLFFTSLPDLGTPACAALRSR